MFEPGDCGHDGRFRPPNAVGKQLGFLRIRLGKRALTITQLDFIQHIGHIASGRFTFSNVCHFEISF
jgi:hypothetical protein